MPFRPEFVGSDAVGDTCRGHNQIKHLKCFPSSKQLRNACNQNIAFRTDSVTQRMAKNPNEKSGANERGKYWLIGQRYRS